MAETKAENEAQPKKPGLFKRLWTKTGLMPIHVMLAFKGALPPVIALAASQAHRYAMVFTTLGYLAAIMSFLALAIQPRAKFIQSMMISLVFVCTAAALVLLQIQCVVAARANPSGGTSVGGSGSKEANAYDSNANAVAAVWLVVWLFIGNYLRSARPQMALPLIQFSIFTTVASTYAPGFTTMEVGMAFVRRLLIAFLTGFGIAAGVSFFILPMTSRATAEKQMAGTLCLLKGCIAIHGSYMVAISQSGTEASPEEKQQAAKLHAMIVQLGGLFGKIKLELSFARKEIAYGYLKPSQYNEIFDMLRRILQPVMGLATFLEMIRALRENHPTSSALPESEGALDAIRKLEQEEWGEVIAISKNAHGIFRSYLSLGFDHVAYQLKLIPRPKSTAKQGDVEQNASDNPQPGEPGFSVHLEQLLDKYHSERNDIIQDWAVRKGLNLPATYFETHLGKPPLERGKTIDARKRLNQHQLYLILYIRFLTYNIGKSLLELSKYADARWEDGTMKKKRIINPGWRRLHKLFTNAFNKSSGDETLSDGVNGGSNIFLGDGLKQAKDPEHLPPSNFYEKVTDKIRAIPRFMSSTNAAFAARAAVATMSFGILGFLHQTRTFFLAQRGVWALIMTAISMDPHVGQGLFGFAGKILGSTVAMVCSIGIWYMCDQKAAAILPIFYIYMAMWVCFLVRSPQYAVVAAISSVTVILIIGYELQVDVIGKEISTASGMVYYPVYELAPFRLLTVLIGLTVAFIWTYFPYPITTHGALRKDVGATLYILANYYSCVHTTMDARLHFGPSIKDFPPTSPVHKLDSVRRKVFSKTLLMLTRLRDYHGFTKFEPTFGGQFPRETYAELITSIRNVFSYLALIAYSSETFTRGPQSNSEKDIQEEEEWLRSFRKLIADTKLTSHEVTSTLCLLSAAMRNGSPLPPYLKAPSPFKTTEMRAAFDPELLSIDHYSHPCYAAYAVIGVASAFCSAELARTTRLVKQLVGEVDFSFHIVSTANDQSSTSSTLWDKWVDEEGNGARGRDKTSSSNPGSGSDEKTKGD